MNKNSFVRALANICDKFASNNPDVIANLSCNNGELHLSVVPTEKVRRQWADEMLEELHECYYRSEVVLSDPDRKIVVLSICDGVYSETAVALCSPNDEFDEKIGIAVAYAKWAGYSIPDFI